MWFYLSKTWNGTWHMCGTRNSCTVLQFLLERALWQTQSKILSKHHLSAARSLWQPQSKIHPKHHRSTARSLWQSLILFFKTRTGRESGACKKNARPLFLAIWSSPLSPPLQSWSEGARKATLEFSGVFFATPPALLLGSQH